MKLGDGNTSNFPKKKASGKMANAFPTIDEKEETHKMMMETETLLITSVFKP